MALTKNSKDKINALIYERADEIEKQLSADGFFLAELCGVKPEQVPEIALRYAIKEAKGAIIE